MISDLINALELARGKKPGSEEKETLSALADTSSFLICPCRYVLMGSMILELPQEGVPKSRHKPAGSGNNCSQQVIQLRQGSSWMPGGQQSLQRAIVDVEEGTGSCAAAPDMEYGMANDLGRSERVLVVCTA